MDFYVLNQNFQMIYILDRYESLIWVDRYNDPGSFELYTPVSKEILTYMRPDNYFKSPKSDRLMIIEDFSIESDSENGNKAKIIGRSLESILDRRIVWTQTDINGNLQAGIKRLINENIISPTTATGGADRKINNFIFEDSTDEKITALKMCNQYNGDNLLAVIMDLCKTNKIGFKVTLNSEHQYVFKLYTGIDRSYKQFSLPWVTFNPAFDNVLSSNYIESNSGYRNVAFVAGEGEGTKRKTRIVGTSTGIFRKELFVDAGDIISADTGSAKKYVEALDQRGKDELTENKIKKEFDAKCGVAQAYTYGEDYAIGDIVQFANEYGIESASRITEYTWSFDANGINTYPTFESVDDGINLSTEDSNVEDTEFFDFLEMTKKLSKTTSTTFEFVSARIVDESAIDIYCSIWGFQPTNVTCSDAGDGKRKLTIIFPKYTSADNLTVRVYLL